MLIGLSGRMGSGKDQAYQYIAEWAEGQGRPVRREGFADRLKLSAARNWFPEIDVEHAIGWANTLKTLDGDYGGVAILDNTGLCVAVVSGRQFLQHYGTEGHRDVFGADFWVDAVLDTYQMGGTEILVVTDVRFPNEAEAILEYGGEVWEILRPRNVAIADNHASEQPLPSELITHVIHNDRDLDHLRDLVQSRVERLVYA